ncbi:hypothetical protein PV682_21380 [Streptomyces niveiscabiei]|uniref:hypothetical protein n=1 Tax=Streptomyces niveiscabiei TaxID=164115 RepID=UPI0029AA344E|nr:hypothetical protein [Streptomyces niveiscabiei]MDX3383994.1 hypothetical protein [Streptomyces niveiscabiei]
MRADTLTEPVEGLAEALAAVDALDRALTAGLLRPRPAQAADLTVLADALAASPLATRVAEATEKAAAGTAAEDHFLALAAARTALLGAAHDALAERIAEAVGRTADATGVEWTAVDGEAITSRGSAEARTAGERTGSGDRASAPAHGATGTAAQVPARAEAPGEGAATPGTPASDTAGEPPTGPGTAAQAPAHEPAPETTNLRAAARTWLTDLARAGWQGIDHELIAGAAPVVSALLAEPSLRRLAALLDGFTAELAASCPGTALEMIPARRWGDLWARGMLLGVPGADAPVAPPGAATGRLLPLGVDLHEHATAVQAQVHAVFEPADGGAPRLVRASVSAPKPDTVVGAGVWQLLRPHMALLAALGEGRAMELDGMPVTGEGDLLWDDAHARPGEPADAFTTARVALPTALTAPTAPLDRHPAQLAVPVLLEGYTAQEGAFVLAGQRLAVDADRIPVAGPLTPDAVAASGACIGLLRWDGGRFAVQPLAVETLVRKKPVALHAGAWAGGTTDKAGVKAEKAATDAVAVLRERAGRLLRK